LSYFILKIKLISVSGLLPKSFQRLLPTFEFVTVNEATSSGYRKRQAHAAAAPLVANAGEGPSSQAAKKPRMDQSSSPSAASSTPASWR